MKSLRIGLLPCMAVALGLVVALISGNAQAMPAFARQTGQECQACHVGSFGPQLTSYGRAFKLNGYVWGPNTSYLDHFSGMVYGGYEHTKGKEVQTASPLSRLAANENITVDQAAIFYGGRLTDKVGLLAQATYKDPNRAFAWDNTDVRFADNTSLFGKDFVYGVTLNNNPSVQDVWQTTPAWGFPYLQSGVATNSFGGVTQPQLFSGTQGARVAGLGGYGLWNDLLYVEMSGYKSLSNATQTALGETSIHTTDHLRGVNPYWRVALQHDFGENYAAIGTYGMAFNRYPANNRKWGADHLNDYGIDATYQATLAGGDHIFSLYGTALHEDLDLKASNAGGLSDNLHDRLTTLKANASYYYHNTWGMTVGRFATMGNPDATYYSSPQQSEGQPNGKPNSSGYIAQFDVTPTGLQDTFGFPYINARFFVQYVYNTNVAGMDQNIDGNGRRAVDNNTLYTGLWFAF